MKPERSIANFDSAAAMLRALARFLHGKDFRGLGLPSTRLLRPAAPLVNAMPTAAREQIYIWSGFSEALPTRKLRDVSIEEICAWASGLYPRRAYPAAMVGSSNGAAVHLCAALGIPWLPQTFLIPVRHGGVDRDDPEAALQWGLGPGRELLAANPDLQLHHMHDANHDRLMISKMAYFRVKRRRLGAAYQRFLEQTLAPNSTVFVLDCRRVWPTTAVAQRHFFQHGALGGAYADEYLEGGERVAEFLQREGSPVRRWETPQPDAERPEAEWGFEASLLEDLDDLAQRRRLRLRRIVFEEPEHLSPFIADLYRWWYRRRHLRDDRLLVESFILLEPWWALRTGSIPYWTKFSVLPDVDRVHEYLDRGNGFDRIDVTLFSHGVDSIGLAGIDRWREVLARGRRGGSFLGVDTAAFPRDFGVFLRYDRAIRGLPFRAPMPAPLTLAELDTFVDEAGDRYDVEWA